MPVTAVVERAGFLVDAGEFDAARPHAVDVPFDAVALTCFFLAIVKSIPDKH